MRLVSGCFVKDSFKDCFSCTDAYRDIVVVKPLKFKWMEL